MATLQFVLVQAQLPTRAYTTVPDGTVVDTLSRHRASLLGLRNAVARMDEAAREYAAAYGNAAACRFWLLLPSGTKIPRHIVEGYGDLLASWIRRPSAGDAAYALKVLEEEAARWARQTALAHKEG